MRKSSAPSADVIARFSFLRAADRLWTPRPLDALEDARPAVEAWLRTQPQFYAENPTIQKLIADSWWITDKPWPWRWSALRADSSGQAQAAREALLAWISRYQLSRTDSWVMDFALHTVADAAMHRRSKLVWIYSPENCLTFNPSGTGLRLKFIRAKGDFEDAGEWERRAMREMRRQVSKHARFLRAVFGERTSGNQRDAEWTALRLAGRTYREIADSESLDEATIRDHIRLFAQRAGLTVPKGRASRRARR